MKDEGRKRGKSELGRRRAGRKGFAHVPWKAEGGRWSREQRAEAEGIKSPGREATFSAVSFFGKFSADAKSKGRNAGRNPRRSIRWRNWQFVAKINVLARQA